MNNSRFTIAAHVVALLGYIGDQSAKSESIARSVNTNPVVVRRTLRLLAKAGIVASTSGPTGGSRLAKPAKAITLCEIYRAVESEGMFPLHPQPPNDQCVIGAHIQAALAPTFAKGEAAMCQAIGETTVADLVARIKRADAASPHKNVCRLE